MRVVPRDHRIAVLPCLNAEVSGVIGYLSFVYSVAL